MADSLTGLRFVITGGGSGIGAATARLAASRGAHVVIGDLNTANGDRTAAEITATGALPHAFRLDVADPTSIETFMSQAAEVLGGIDVLHNNAGIADAMLTDELSLTDLPMDVWDRVMAVNLRGPFLCTRAALPWLRQSKSASVVNAGSVGSIVGFPHTLAYGASKGAIALLTKNLAIELAPDHIRVNCYCPGVTETQMTVDYLASAADPARARAEMVSTHLVDRLGSPDEVAQVACFLGGPDSSFVNGVTLVVDGGQLAWRGQRDIA
jgi:NAD(P)-dependent dehydrogenase (short-subunit alcohol dehydrogenase family)